jgi:ribosomal-protein-alanine N-acetyltransferase
MGHHSTFETFPILETKRLLLRELIADDTRIIYEIFSDPKVTRYYDVETFTRVEQAAKLIRWCANRFKYQDGIRWGIVDRQTNRLMGTCGFHNWRKSHRKAEMGYELAEKYWGNGFAIEAITGIIEFGFIHLNFNRVEAWTMLQNKGSMAVLNKAGFSREGILRQYGYWHGRFQDVMMFSLLREEWDDRNC